MGKLDSQTIDQINWQCSDQCRTITWDLALNLGSLCSLSLSLSLSLSRGLGSWPRVSVTGDGLGRTRRRCQQPG